MVVVPCKPNRDLVRKSPAVDYQFIKAVILGLYVESGIGNCGVLSCVVCKRQIEYQVNYAQAYVEVLPYVEATSHKDHDAAAHQWTGGLTMNC